MFTGIVEGQGKVEGIVPRGAAHRLCLELGALAEGVAVGDSVAIDGTCLTAVSVAGGRVEFDVIRETVERTAFAMLKVGDKVNVERSMRADGRFHGHFVTGHVDAAGRILVKRAEPGQVWLTVEVPPRLTAAMVEKGSVTLDGVSLTLTEVLPTRLSVALIPHTLEVTTLGAKGPGHLVNVEVDVMGKWVRRLIAAYLPGAPDAAPTPEAAPEPAGPRILGPEALLSETVEDMRRAGFFGQDRGG